MAEIECALYTDGSCLSNPGGRGGWAFVAVDATGGVFCKGQGAVMSTTSNRMELGAILKGLIALGGKMDRVLVISDSQYAARALNSVIQEMPLPSNSDLQVPLRRATIGFRHVAAEWSRGHVGDKWNELCDTMANKSAQEGPWGNDKGYKSPVKIS